MTSVQPLGQAVYRGWRVFATGLSFAVFGFGTLLLTVTLFPCVWLSTRDVATRRLRFQHSYHLGCRFYIGFMQTLGLISWEVRGLEHLRGGDRGLLVLANHPTLLDAVFLLAWMPEAVCIVKRALWHNPFLRWAVVDAGYIGNRSPEVLVEDCVASLRAGNALIMFPEGTRSVPGQPLRFRRGAARVAMQAGVPVVPVHIDCRPITLTKGVPWYRVPEWPPHFRFVVAPPLPAATFAARPDERSAQAARRVTGLLQTLLPPPEGSA